MRIKSRFVVASCFLASITGLAGPLQAAPEVAKAEATKQESSAAPPKAAQTSPAVPTATGAQTTPAAAKGTNTPAKPVAKAKAPLAQKIPKNFQEGLVYQSMGMNDQAITNYKLALKDDPSFVSTYNNLAQCYTDRGAKTDRDDAKKLIDEALKLSPDNVGSLHASALLADQDKRYEDAEKAYKRILVVQPLNFRAVQNLSELYYYKLHNPGKAKTLLKATLKQNHPDPEQKKVFVEALKNLDDLMKGKKKVATTGGASK